MKAAHGVAAVAAAVGLYIAYKHSRRLSAAAAEPAIEAHQATEVSGLQAELMALAPEIASAMRMKVHCTVVADGTPPPPGGKLVYFIRHGEGHHNVVQREWRATPGWDGVSEPYTLDTDPAFKYLDPSLTAKGEGEARALQPRTAGFTPDLLVVSPLVRATQTGLIAFERHVGSGRLKVLAHELCHEIGGKHTCDKRGSKTQLRAAYSNIDYSLVESEEDPMWLDGRTREPLRDLSMRAGRFVQWMRSRPESSIAVASHSAFLLSTFNAVLATDSAEARQWFGTGEMRAVHLTFTDL
eukprot:7172372-Prymnesium_polylepis.6